MITPRTTDPLTDPAWRAMHAHYLDSVAQQSPKLRGILGREVGTELEGFVWACVRGPLVIASQLIDADTANRGLNYVIGIRVDDGITTLATVHAQRLGVNGPDMEAAELDIIARRRPGMWPDGTGDPGRPETWPQSDSGKD